VSVPFLLVNRPQDLRRRGFWVMVLIGGVGLVPIIAWNAANVWG
jgi:hypothetical protein